MRVPARQNRARQRVAVTSSVPAPRKGWNNRDSIAAMGPDEAVILTNWFPSAAEVSHRKGSAQYVTGIGGGTPVPVETLAVYKPPSGLEKMFGFADTALYDVSATGAVGAAVVSGLTNARWKTLDVTTSGGNYMVSVNGVDKLLLYDGTSWAPIDGASTPSITGVATTSLISATLHMERVWYIEKNSLNAWYTAAGAITGALTKFPLGGVFKGGGYLLAQGTWTLDGGRGTNDLAVFVSSTGEVAVYQGTDPASSSTWTLVGVYTIGKPIGMRCLRQLAGDLLIITTDGVISCSQYLTTDRASKSVALTDIIQSAVASAVTQYNTQYGWELAFYPAGSMLILNVPVTTSSEQYVMNTITRAWCRFTNWDAECFAVFNDELYFGMNGEVRKAWTGTSDAGEEIQSEVLQAFNYFGNRNQQKHFTLVRPILGWDVNPAEIRIGVDVDFEIQPPAGQIAPAVNSGVLIWDVGLWGVGTWGGGIGLNKDWYSVYGVGFAGALHMKVSTAAAAISFVAYDIVFEPGGVV